MAQPAEVPAEQVKSELKQKNSQPSYYNERSLFCIELFNWISWASEGDRLYDSFALLGAS
jgi:hypothetical protein